MANTENKMAKDNIKTAFIIALFFIILTVAVIYANYSKKNYGDYVDGLPNESKVLCTEESRLGEYCIELYKPVCGWFNAEKVQCIKYPCAITFGNSCFACKDLNVRYWTEGACTG